MSKDLIKWKIERALTTFEEGRSLERLCSYNGAINRYYYSAFYAVSALLITKRLG